MRRGICLFTCVAFFALSLVFCLPATTSAAPYPTRNVEFLVGFPPGGVNDTNARALANIMQNELGKYTMVVVNKPGGAGAIALQELAANKANPHKILSNFWFADPLWNPATGLKLEDYTPVALVNGADVYIVVRNDSRFKTIKELLDAMKTESNITISIGGAIDGKDPFKWDEIREAYGIERVNYVTTNGGAESFARLLGGHVSASFAVASVCKDFVKTGEIRVLAVLSDERMAELPDVPTLKEIGIDVTYIRNYGVFMGADVPKDVIEFWHQALSKAVQSKTWQDYLQGRGLRHYFEGPEAYKARIIKEGSAYMKYLDTLAKQNK